MPLSENRSLVLERKFASGGRVRTESPGLRRIIMFSERDVDFDVEDDDHTNWREPTIFQGFDDKSTELSNTEVARPNCHGDISDPSMFTSKGVTLSDTCSRNDATKIAFQRNGAVDHHRCIIHIDFDCFYCQVEAIRNPALTGRPFGVYQKQIVVSSNYVARHLGVKKMSTKAEALKVCPEMIMVNGEDLTVYRDFSMKMFNLLKTFSPVVERIGFDENFIDVTKSINNMAIKPHDGCTIAGHCFGYEGKTDMTLNEIFRMEGSNVCQCGCFLRLAMTSLLAANIRKLLHAELGLTSSAGIAHCKVLAKLIGKTHKPNQQTTILPTYAEEFLSCKNVREIPGIGSRCSKELKKIGVETVNQLAIIPKEELMEKFGTKLGNFLTEIALGIDNSVVNVSNDVPKSISEEESFRKLTDFGDVKVQMKLLIKKLIKRLEKDGRTPRTIKLSLRKHNVQNSFARVSRQRHFDPRTLNSDSKEVIENAILDNVIALFDKMIDDRKSFNIAVINIGFTSFDEVATSSISRFFVKESIRNKTEAKAIDVHCNERVETSVKTCVTRSDGEETNKTYTDTPMYERDPTIITACTNTSTVPEVLQKCNTAEDHCSKDLDATTLSIHTPHNFGHNKAALSSPDNKPFKSNVVNCTRKIFTNTSDNQMLEMKRNVETCLGQVTVMDSSRSDMLLDPYTKPTTSDKDSERFHSVSASNKEDGIEFPAGVDSAVFRELPAEIQNELVQNWKRKEREAGSINRKVAPRKKKQKKSVADVGSNSILNYFAK